MKTTKLNLINKNIYLKTLTNKDVSHFETFFIKKYKNNYFYNLNKTFINLRKTLQFIEAIISKKGNILFVGHRNYKTKDLKKTNSVDKSIKALAEETDQIYVEYFWKAGAFTNNAVLQNIKTQYEIKNKLITKKNNDFTKRKKKFDSLFTEILNLDSLPNAIVSFSYKQSASLINEAAKLKIPVICLVGENDNLVKNIDYPIIGNDVSPSSLQFFVKVIKRAIQRGQLKQKYAKTF